MFSGLSSYIKKLLPKRLFYRALLIVATPIIILQVIISIVFFDSLWIKTNKGMTRALVGEIKFFINAYENEEYEKDNLIKLFKEHHNFNVKFQTFGDLPETDMERWFSPMDRTLRRELKNRFNNYWFDTTSYKELIELRIEYLNGYFEFLIPKDRVTNTSARLFALWITFPAFLLITVALIFLKNQTRPIINLAKASEKFGRGEDVEEFRPSGALEIRQAGFEFERMRKRILRHFILGRLMTISKYFYQKLFCDKEFQNFIMIFLHRALTQKVHSESDFLSIYGYSQCMFLLYLYKLTSCK